MRAWKLADWPINQGVPKVSTRLTSSLHCRGKLSKFSCLLGKISMGEVTVAGTPLCCKPGAQPRRPIVSYSNPPPVTRTVDRYDGMQRT